MFVYAQTRGYPLVFYLKRNVSFRNCKIERAPVKTTHTSPIHVFVFFQATTLVSLSSGASVFADAGGVSNVVETTTLGGSGSSAGADCLASG